MPDGQIRAADRPPILWIALGRQRVGKTVLLNTAVQYFRGLGNPLRVWNADQQNRSHTLSLFFPDAEEVTGSGIEDGMAWTEARIVHQIAHGYDAVLDVGGGATGFAKLVQEVPLLDALDSSSLWSSVSSAPGRSGLTSTIWSSSRTPTCSCRRPRWSSSIPAWCCPGDPRPARSRRLWRRPPSSGRSAVGRGLR